MKTPISSVILLTLFALCAHGGEVERFIRETLAEQRTRSALESNSAAEVIDLSLIHIFPLSCPHSGRRSESFCACLCLCIP